MEQNHNFYDVLKRADEIIGDGLFDAFQRFTCAACGQRLTIDVPNTFYEKGTCDKCGALTDIVKDGCNFMIVTRGALGLAQKS